MIASIIKILEGVKLLIPFIAEMVFGGKTLRHAIKSSFKQKVFFIFVIVTMIVAGSMTLRVFQLASDTIILNERIQKAEADYAVCKSYAEENSKLTEERDRLLEEIRQIKKIQLAKTNQPEEKQSKKKHSIRDETLNAINSKLLEGIEK